MRVIGREGVLEVIHRRRWSCLRTDPLKTTSRLPHFRHINHIRLSPPLTTRHHSPYLLTTHSPLNHPPFIKHFATLNSKIAITAHHITLGRGGVHNTTNRLEDQSAARGFSVYFSFSVGLIIIIYGRVGGIEMAFFLSFSYRRFILGGRNFHLFVLRMEIGIWDLGWTDRPESVRMGWVGLKGYNDQRWEERMRNVELRDGGIESEGMGRGRTGGRMDGADAISCLFYLFQRARGFFFTALV